MKTNTKKVALNFKFLDLFSRDYRLITATLVAITLLIYWQVAGFEFVWDEISDPLNHLDNPFVAQPSFKSFSMLFTEPYFGMYIPISYLFWGVLKSAAQLFSLPINSVLHLANVLVHIVNGLLVFTILRQFVSSKSAVALGASFFLLHPMQVEVVAWVSEMRNLLAFLFAFTALYFYLKNQAKFSLLPLLLFVLALLSKPSAVVLPLMIIVINHFHYNFKLKNNISKTLPFLLLALIAALIIVSIQSVNMPDSQVVSYWQRPIIWLNSITIYLWHLLYPVNLNAVYGLPAAYMASNWWFYIFPLATLGLAAYLRALGKKQPLLLFASALFLLGFLPTSGFVSFSFQLVSVVADRYLYFSFVGVALFIAAIASQNGKKTRALLAIVLVVFTFLSAIVQIPVWQNDIKLWNHTADYAQYDKRYAKIALGAALHDEGWKLAKLGKNQQALKIFDKIIADKLHHKEMHHTFYIRGVIMMEQKHYQKALVDFGKSIKINAKNNNAYEGKINVFIRLGQCKNAQSEINLMRDKQLKVPLFLLQDWQKICQNKVNNPNSK